ncbi:hypothetical protein ACFPRL_14145 [Pseudoclavibacter helvolus]
MRAPQVRPRRTRRNRGHGRGAPRTLSFSAALTRSAQLTHE